MKTSQSVVSGMRSHASVLSFANIRIFDALARHASFSRAAEQLGVSQPYVSAHIASLEARIGVQLFRRVGRRAYLTEAGRMFQERAVRILAEVEEAEHCLADARGVVAGPLSIAATATPAACIVPSCLERFLASYPSVSVTLRIFGSPDVERSVLEGRSDLGVLVSEPEASGFTVEPVGRDELVVVVSPRHPLAGRSEVAPQHVARERFIIREPSSGTRRFIEARFGEIGVHLNYGLELNNNEAIKALVASNLGVSILSQEAVRFELLAGHLVALRVSGLPLVRTLNLVTAAAVELGPAARALRAVMLAAAHDSSGSD